MLRYRGLPGGRGYPRAAQAVAGIQCCFGEAWPVTASAGGAGAGATGQTCGYVRISPDTALAERSSRSPKAGGEDETLNFGHRLAGNQGKIQPVPRGEEF